MFGIVEILGASAAAGRIMKALKRLEYRGDVSAGAATLEFGRERTAGKAANPEMNLGRDVGQPRTLAKSVTVE
jgi:glucosamine 6-phosphate synthetase-like amidotransferase/phosphosugar isomerase protein